MAKKITSFRSSALGRSGSPERGIVRLSDPEVRSAVRRQVREIASSKETALKFLQEIGIATPTGRLTKRYGG